MCKRCWFVLFWLGLGWLGPVFPARAQTATGLRFTALPLPHYTFGEYMTFTVGVAGDAPITEVLLFTRAANAPPAQWPAIFTPGSTLTATVHFTLALTTAFSPFSAIEFWWVVRDAAGNSLTAAAQTFYYEDARFIWQREQHGILTVNWYQGDAAFGQLALAIATQALTYATREIRVALPQQLTVYIYPELAAAQAALQQTGRAWAGGHASPELGVVVIVVPPGLNAETELGRALPHELTHILLYHAAPDTYAQLPTWFNEGLATLNQTQPDPPYPAALAAARQAQTLLPLTQLCAPFPSDPERAILAYAQSESLMRYVRATYGAEGIFRLLSAYAVGDSCEAGVQRALGHSLTEVEQGWQQSLTPAAGVAPWAQLFPWIVLGGVLFMVPLVFGGLQQLRSQRVV